MSDFAIVLEDGTSVTPICALQYPPNEPNEPNELQTVNLIGDFGKTSGPRPSQLQLVGALEGHLPLDEVWQPLGKVAPHEISQLEAAPFIVDAWTLTPQLTRWGRQPLHGRQHVRTRGVLQRHDRLPEWDEVDANVIASYRADYELPSGESRSLTALAVGDLSDHPPKVFLDDNMHDLCVSDVPSGAALKAIEIGGNLLQDPNGDPNDAQTFRLPLPALQP